MAKNDMELYGWLWPSILHPLELEFECIRKGGIWQREDGQIAGKGLFFHYKKAIEIIWPEFAQHRWFDVILDAYLNHEWIGLSGPKSSGKTACITVILLTDYYCFSSSTTVILSSTTMEGLDNRVFGELKMRHRAAKRRVEWLPGNLIEGRHRIVTDDHDEFLEGRDFRNGIMGVPIRKGDRNAMENIVGIKNKRKRWFCDEIQTLSSSALDGTANFMEPGADCKFMGAGNPSNIMDAHGKLCEPDSSLGGWDGGIDQTGKTKTWKTRFSNGCCVQLPGDDCPNMDVPEGKPIPFPFLMTREQMAKDAYTWGRTDWHYMMFNMGRWPRGMAENRIITRQMCINGHALEEARWASLQRKTLVCMDAGFGGDRCVVHRLEVGKELWQPEHPGEINAGALTAQEPSTNDDRQIIERIDTQIVPIEGSEVKDAEDQIVLWAKAYCERHGVPPEHFAYEPGMRPSLVQKFSKLWSHRCVVVDFGGKPSEGEVSFDIPVSCRDYYFNFNTELWYTLQLIVECQQFRGLDEETMEEACNREFMRVGGNKIKLETKIDYKKKVGFSPDRADALVVGIQLAKQLGFVIKRQKPDTDVTDDRWKSKLKEQARAYWTAGQLAYD